MKILLLVGLVVNLAVSIIFIPLGFLGAGMACGGEQACNILYGVFVPGLVSIVTLAIYLLGRDRRILIYLLWFLIVINCLVITGDLMGLRFMPISYLTLF